MIKLALLILFIVILIVAYNIRGDCEIKPMIDHPSRCIDIVKERLKL